MSGSLRIRSVAATPPRGPALPGAAAALGAPIAPVPGSPAPPKPADEYLGRLVKLIPAEVIALYLGVQGTFGKNASALSTWAFICLVLVIVVRAVATYDNKDVQWGGVCVSSVSFILWIYATGGEFLFLTGPDSVLPKQALDWLKLYPSAAVAVWTFVIPYLYNGEKVP